MYDWQAATDCGTHWPLLKVDGRNYEIILSAMHMRMISHPLLQSTCIEQMGTPRLRVQVADELVVQLQDPLLKQSWYAAPQHIMQQMFMHSSSSGPMCKGA